MDLAGFIAVATLVVVTPGPDMTLVARNTFAGGRPSGLATSAGTCSGLLVHATAAALGLSAVLLASSQAFTVVKIAGAAYLISLGIRTILGARREALVRDGVKVTDPWAAYRQGVLTNVLNPKVAIFFLSLLPQFVEPGPGFTWRLLVLSGLFIVMGLVWLTIYTIALHAASGVVGRPRVKTFIESVTGCVLMALGVRLVFQRR
ncbi:MAG: Lysine exporter protein [Actinomycetia bacterium]|nr:Lysine exporter protein [Actinomycetes bacterium]